MPCGIFNRGRSEDNFSREYLLPHSAVSTERLANLEHTQNIEIEHARNMGEYRIGSR